MYMPTRLRKRYLRLARTARSHRHKKSPVDTIEILSSDSENDSIDDDSETTTWKGGVSHNVEEWTEDDWEWDINRVDECASEEEVGILDIEPLNEEEEIECLRGQMEREMQTLRSLQQWGGIMKKRTAKEWKKAEVTVGRSVHTKGSPGESTERRHRQLAREREVAAAASKISSESQTFVKHFGGVPVAIPTVSPPPSLPPAPLPVPSPAAWEPLPSDILQDGVFDLQRFLQFQASQSSPPPPPEPVPIPSTSNVASSIEIDDDDDVFVGGYASDFQDEEWESDNDGDEQERQAVNDSHAPTIAELFRRPRKRRKLDVPVRVARQKAREERLKQQTDALTAINKHITSKKTEFQAGQNSLQARRARCVQSCLHMMVKGHRRLMDASVRAAEANGFGPEWGSRLTRIWVHDWINSRILPQSSRGHHSKTESLLDDPAIRDELLSYLRSNKWVTDPAKFSEFVRAKFVSPQAQEYLRHLVDDEIPKALRKSVWDKQSRFRQLANGWPNSAGNIKNIKRLFIMMDMSDRMWWLTDRRNSFPQC
ncbi:hypothetical protein MIND_00302700 [Mycena indigotica]|uniref:Uncharacterized protein n=1 Tax=Mycena indigotica TaxID=2126181 RepID=A0A8H6WEC6_9AGAR|nr:uncharacterized protein MIND_00302700 [Mycena indigotica]KAF7309324.1 hypothetical protein MIND_00302700 [Mycena indigotica]